jgi:putative two-component system response regulator
LPLARAVLAHARACANAPLEHVASLACGILCADIGDPVAAIGHQVDALRLAHDDRVSASRAWNNIGLAMSVAGHSAMAVRCYERALAALEGNRDAAAAQYGPLTNLAQSQFDIASYEDGLVSAHLALAIEGAAKRDPMNALRLRRNVVRLLVATGRVEDAEPHVLDAIVLAERIRTPRATIAASLTQAVYDLARGDSDVGLTRLDAALSKAREVPAALRDALSCVVRAEEMAGHSERALLRLNELSDVVYGPAVAAARRHVELASIAEREHAMVAPEHEQVRARLISKLAQPRRPDGWGALERLAVSACIRIEPTGLHGKRVGALAKALAMAGGCDPLQALEIGFACEMHDVGMVTVPEELIAKRPLMPEVERNAIERHVRAGAEILSDDQHPRIMLAREVARYHHAHWDGSGHPEGVAGTRIPYAARICAIADAYDDGVFGLRGSPRQTMDAALKHLRDHAGRRYDPQLVAIFESMIRAETHELGLDIAAGPGMENFQQLVTALQEDRGFV